MMRCFKRTLPLVLSLLGPGCSGAGFTGDGDVDSDTDSDSDTDGLDCAEIPAGPFDLTRLSGPVAAEDLAFDSEGNVVGSDGNSLLKSPYGGPPSVFAAVSQRAGLRYLPDGRLAVADDTDGNLLIVDQDGTAEVFLSGLAYPNGIAVDQAGFIYLTEKNAGRVRRIDPTTGDFTILVDGAINQPNGLTFDREYRTLYVAGTSGEGIVYRISIAEDGTPGALEEWTRGIGRGRLDGLACDACGNVYVCDYGSDADNATLVYRISPDGKRARLIADSLGAGGPYGTFLANMDWGSGLGGWSETVLYFAETRSGSIFAMDVEVPSKPRVYP